MTTQFKVGDRVRCISPRDGLSLGCVYTVVGASHAYVNFQETGNTDYFASRFELAEQSGPKCFRILRKGIQWGTAEYGSVEDAEAAITKSGPVGEPLVIVALSTVKAVTVKRVLEAA